MKLAGVTIVSRTMARTPSDLRLRRGRGRCWTQTPSWLLREMAGEAPEVGSNAG